MSTSITKPHTYQDPAALTNKRLFQVGELKLQATATEASDSVEKEERRRTKAC